MSRLVALKVAVSVIVFFIMANQESDEYTDEFSAASKKVIEAFLDIAETKIGAVSSLGVALVAHGAFPVFLFHRGPFYDAIPLLSLILL